MSQGRSQKIYEGGSNLEVECLKNTSGNPLQNINYTYTKCALRH